MIQGTPTRIITLLQAIQSSHVTTIDIMAATGMGRNGISELGRLLAADGLITREFIKPDQRPDAVFSHSAGRTSVVLGLTEKGMACIDGLAETPSYNLYTIKTANGTNEHSIRDFCNQPDYRQWLQSMKRLAKGNHA